MEKRMRKYIYFILIPCMVLFSSCGAKKQAVSQEPSAVSQEPEEPAWHTCLIQGARATVYTNEDKISANLTMQTVRDSMIVISVMPMMGIEMMRIEATPMEIIAIDKVHGRYAIASFAELNRKLTPSLNWDVLQQVCTGELPTGEEKARLQYTFGMDVIELVINYSPRRLDVPVRIGNQRLDRYTRIDISKWL